MNVGAILVVELARRGIKVIGALSEHICEAQIESTVFKTASTHLLCIINPTRTSSGCSAHTSYAPLLANEIDKISREHKLYIRALLPGSESGVETCDQLSSLTSKTRGNSTQVFSQGFSRCEKCSRISPSFIMGGNSVVRARRDKYLLAQALSHAGLRAPSQLLTSEWNDVRQEFVKRHQITRQAHQEGDMHEDDLEIAPCLVLKPTQSAASDRVCLVRSLQEAQHAFDAILSKPNVFQEENSAVLLQEYLRGPEFVVDTVSCSGVHKVVAIWEYDKRPCNSRYFVYFGTRLVLPEGDSATSAICLQLCNYTLSVLKALKVQL